MSLASISRPIRALAAILFAVALGTAADAQAPATAAGASLAEDGGAVWSFSADPAGNNAGSSAYLTFGIPETDAIAFSATCESGLAGPEIPVMLIVDFGANPDGTPVAVEFLSAGFNADYGGEVSVVSSEYAGVSLGIGIGDRLWPVLQRNRSVTFGIEGMAQTTVPLAGSATPVRDFLAACRANFAAYDASATPDIDVVEYACDDGTSLVVDYDNSRSYSIALVTFGTMTGVALIQVISGSGAKYSNGDMTLHSKADEAYFESGGTGRTCTAN